MTAPYSIAPKLASFEINEHNAANEPAISFDLGTWHLRCVSDPEFRRRAYVFAAAMYANPLDTDPAVMIADWCDECDLPALADALRDCTFAEWPICEITKSAWLSEHARWRELAQETRFFKARVREMRRVLRGFIYAVKRTSMVGVSHALGWQWNTVVSIARKEYRENYSIEGNGVASALNEVWCATGAIQVRGRLLIEPLFTPTQERDVIQ